MLEDLALYDNESWNDPRDFAKLVKAITLPQDVPMVPTTLRLALKTPNRPSLSMRPRVSMKQEVRKLNSMLESLGLVPRSFNAKFIFSKDDDGEVMFIKIVRDNEPQCDDPHKVEGATTEEPVVEYFNTFPTRNELTYHRNKEDNRREVQYVMSKILGFYKECLELGPEYLTGVDDEEEVMLYLMRRSLEVLRKFHRTILGG
ncbi:hypothetical protein Tco_1249506 [Tanacetum coccineum]